MHVKPPSLVVLFALAILVILSQVEAFTITREWTDALQEIGIPYKRLAITQISSARGELLSKSARSPAGGRPKSKPKPTKPKDNPQTVPKDRDDDAASNDKDDCKRSLTARCDDGDTDVESNPESLDPVHVGEDEDFSDPENVVKGWGEKAVQNLEAKLKAVKERPNDLADKPFASPLSKAYKLGETVEMHVVEPNPNNLDGFVTVETMFRSLSLDMNTKFKGKQVRAKNVNGQTKLVQENFFSDIGSRDGVIVAKFNNMKSNNIAEEGDGKISHWSDILLQTALDIYGGQLPDFKYVMRDNVNNAGSKNAIDRIHNQFKDTHVVNGKGTFDPFSSIEKERELAQSLIGCRNGKGVAYMLTDYPHAFHQKRIVKVHTWVDSNPSDPVWSMAFELGPS